MKIDLAYGRTGLTVDLPADRTTIVEPRFVPGLPDEADALREALRNPISAPPLTQWLRGDDTVGISICDITRPMPSARVLPVLLAEIEQVVLDPGEAKRDLGRQRGDAGREPAEPAHRPVQVPAQPPCRPARRASSSCTASV
jgi:hypothetical protein